MKSDTTNHQSIKTYKFESVTEQRIPGTVEATREKAVREIIEAGEADYGDTYFENNKIDFLEEKEI
jgi:hypothetical protein